MLWQQAVWWFSVVGWWLPLMCAASLGWTLLKNVKAALVIGAVVAVFTYLIWGLPGSGIAPLNTPTPDRPVATTAPQPAYVPLPAVPRPAPQQAARQPQPRCYFYAPVQGVTPHPPANFPADLDPTKPARWCDPSAHP